MFSIKESIASLDSYTLEEFNVKFNLLKIEAQKRNFDLRDDSTLIWNYCLDKAGIHWTAKSVIDELMGIDILYKYTNYNSNCQEGLRLIANEMKRRHNIKWDILWHFVREYGTAAIKYETLRRNKLMFGQTTVD